MRSESLFWFILGVVIGLALSVILPALMRGAVILGVPVVLPPAL